MFRNKAFLIIQTFLQLEKGFVFTNCFQLPHPDLLIKELFRDIGIKMIFRNQVILLESFLSRISRSEVVFVGG